MFQSGAFQSTAFQLGPSAAAIPPSGALSESAAPADAQAARLVTTGGVSEAPAPADAVTARATSSSTETESGRPADNLAAAAKFTGVQAETLGSSATSAITLDGAWLDGSVAGTGAVNVATTTVSLTTSGPDRLIVALCGVGPNVSGVGITSVAGGGLTWTKQVGAIGGGTWNHAEIWTAPAPTALTAQTITLTLTAADSGVIVFQVAALTGHNVASPIGANGSASVNGGVPTTPASIDVVAQAAGSMLLGVWLSSTGPVSAGTAYTALANTTYLRQINWVADNFNSAAGYLTSPTSAAGSVTFGSASLAGYLGGTSDLGAVGLEILASTGGSGPGAVDAYDATVTTSGGPVTGALSESAQPADAQAARVAYASSAQVDALTGSGTANTLALDGAWVDGGVNGGGASSSTRTVTISTSGADRLIVALCGIGSGVGNSGITGVSGGGLTWTKRVGSVGTSGGIGWNYAEVWTAPAPTQLTTQVITLTLAASQTAPVQFTVGALAGHNISSPIGATAVHTGDGTTQFNADVTISATSANSWLLGVWDAPAGPVSAGTNFTPLANTTYFAQHNDVTGDHNGATGRLTAVTSGAGSVTFGSGDLAVFLSGNTSMGAAAVEILAAAVSAAGPSDGYSTTASFQATQVESAQPSDAQAARVAYSSSTQVESGAPADAYAGATSGASGAQTDSAAPADAQTATATFIGSLNESEAPAEANTASLAAAGTLVESASPADSQAARVFYAVQEVDGATPADSQDATKGGSNATQTDSGQPADGQVGAASFAVSGSESGAPGEANAATILGAVSESEFAQPLDAQAARVVYSAQMQDGAAPADAFQTAATFAVTQVEFAAPADAVGQPAASFQATQVESAQPSDAQDGNKGGTSSAQVESAQPADAAQATFVAQVTQVESAAPGEAVTAALVAAGSVSESGAPADAAATTAVFAVTEVESAAPAESQDATRIAAGLNGQISESAAPGGAQVATFSARVSQVESAQPADAFQAAVTFAGAQTDAAAPSDAQDGSKPAAVGAVSEAPAPSEVQAATYAAGAALSDSAQPADQFASTARFSGTEQESAAPADQFAGGLTVTGTLVESVQPSDAQAARLVVSGQLSESAAPADGQDARARFSGQLVETASPRDQIDGGYPGHPVYATQAESAAPSDIQSADYAPRPPVHGRYAPTTVPTWAPALMSSLGTLGKQAVVDACGGPARIATNPISLTSGPAPLDPQNPSVLAAWTYEGDLYRACYSAGILFRPGALYLAILSGRVKARLVNPGPTTWLALPDLSTATVAALVRDANALADGLVGPLTPLPEGRAPWTDPAGVYVQVRAGLGLYAPAATPGWAPVLMSSIGAAAQTRVIAACGGLGEVLTSPWTLVEGPAPLDPNRASLGYSLFWYEGDFYAALRANSLALRPGALYLGLLAGAIRARLVDPGKVIWLALPDLKLGTLAPLVGALNALVP